MNEELPKKRLLIATDSFVPRWDGVTRFLVEVIPRLAKKYDITVLAPDFKGIAKELPAKVIRFPLLGFAFGDINFSKPGFKQIKEEVAKADIVWVQTIGPIGVPAIHYARKLGKRVIAYIHSVEWELASNAVKRFKSVVCFVTKLYARHFYNKCDLLMVPAHEIGRLFSLNKINTLKKVIHLGVNINMFAPPVDKTQAKREAGLDPENIIIGYCGRIGREKDLKTLYRAFASLQKEHNDLMLLLVGDGVKELVEFFKSKPGVRVTGSVNNVIPYYQAMDIFVLPSLTETTSLSTMEAMACGLPVVTTRVGYIKEYVKNGYNGLFFPERNNYVLKRNIEQLLLKPVNRRMLGNNARKTIVHTYSWDRTIKEIEETFAVFEKE
jgi:glycosyltransferase involved in cell wall biosynthesis